MPGNISDDQIAAFEVGPLGLLLGMVEHAAWMHGAAKNKADRQEWQQKSRDSRRELIVALLSRQSLQGKDLGTS